MNPDDSGIVYLRHRLLAWAGNNPFDFPWRITANRWHALTAEIMLQRTRAEQVVPVYRYFCRAFQSPSDYPKQKKVNIFDSLGLRWRNREFIKLAEVVADQDIPESKEELLSLPGVGDYISSAIRSLHFGIRDSIIDSNVVRIYGRYFGFSTDGETRRKRWLKELADRITPKRKFREFNYALIDFTRTVCGPRPICTQCILRRKCKYYLKEKERKEG